MSVSKFQFVISESISQKLGGQRATDRFPFSGNFHPPESFEKMSLNRKQKIFLAFAAILAVLVIIDRFLPAVGASYSTREEMDALRRQILRYRIALQEGAALTSEVEAMTRALGQFEAGLLGGGTPALAAVEIQNLLSGIAEETDVDLDLTRPMPPDGKDEDSYLLDIPLFARFSADIRQLRRFLHRVENSSKFLQVERLRIRSANSREPDSYQVEMTVRGFMRRNPAA
jgi:hypothetical protein